MNDEKPATPQPADELTLYQQMEMGAYATCIAEDKIAEILGVELIGISFDDYDGSFEIFPERDVADAAPSAQQHAAILALGCTKYWINFPDSTQRYGMGARTEVKNHCRWDRFNNHTLAKRTADQQQAAASAGAAKALEFAEYMAKGAENLMACIDAHAKVVQQVEHGNDLDISTPETDQQWIERALEHVTESATGLRSDIYEFRKRAKKVGAALQSPPVATAQQSTPAPTPLTNPHNWFPALHAIVEVWADQKAYVPGTLDKMIANASEEIVAWRVLYGQATAQQSEAPK